MKFRVICQKTSSGAHSPIQVVDQSTGKGVAWINRYLDREYVRRLADKSLYSYAHSLLHFVRWWESVHHTGEISAADLTESTLLDYVRFQSGLRPPPSASTINDRTATADRAIRNQFPDAPCQVAHGFHQPFLHRRPMGLGRPRFELSRLRIREPKLNIVPLSVDEVARFWSSFRNARDLAIVGLMLMQGLRSAEGMALNRDDVLFSEGQLRVRGKGSKLRLLPLAPETTQLLDHYLRVERPDPCSAALFVVLKGPARGQRMTSAGLRSLFRHHRRTTGIQKGNPHRFRHTFASDMVRAGISLPALMQMMGHADIETTMHYVKVSPQDVYLQYARAGAVYPSATKDLLMRWRRSPLQHPLAPSFAHAVKSLCTALTASSKRNYDIAVRSFLVYLGTKHPKITRLEQLRRDPHILGWMAHLRAQNPPLATATCIGRLFALRTIFHELARTSHLAELAQLLLREDIPRSPHTLPRPLTPEQDQLLQQEFVRRNDLGGNVFLLLRSTGMRIGECVDLSYDCLRSTAPNQWAIHVPFGKLKTERMVPVDAFGRDLVYRLRFFRSLDPLPRDGRLLARPGSKVAILVQLRDYLHQVCHSLGLPTDIVPHQFRHTYATEMLRSGVSFPILMKLLGHVDPGMTMRYLDVALTDLEREFQLARSKPRHLPPQPKSSTAPVRAGLDGLIDALVAAQHLMEMFRRSLTTNARKRLLRLTIRLIKILAEIKKLQSN